MRLLIVVVLRRQPFLKRRFNSVTLPQKFQHIFLEPRFLEKTECGTYLHECGKNEPHNVVKWSSFSPCISRMTHETETSIYVVVKWQSLFFPSFFGHAHYTSIMSCVFIYIYIIVKWTSIFFQSFLWSFMATTLQHWWDPHTGGGGIFLKSGSEKNLLMTCNSISRKCEFFSGTLRRWSDPERRTQNTKLTQNNLEVKIKLS